MADDLRAGGVTTDLGALALDLKTYLEKYHHITDVTGPAPLSADWRAWELSFTHRRIRRHFVYRVERVDPRPTMFQALRADTTGELLVRIPNERADGFLDNDIYYPPHG